MKKIDVSINYEKIVGLKQPIDEVYIADGVKTHIRRRHPGMLKYINQIEEIINKPDYYGYNEKQPRNSFECIKRLDENVLVAIKFDRKGEYYFVASMYEITDGKLAHMLQNGRIIKIDFLE